jgi:hypothetical protein
LEDGVDVIFDNGALYLTSAEAIGQRTLFPQGDKASIAVTQMGRLQDSPHGKWHIHADVDDVSASPHRCP